MGNHRSASIEHFAISKFVPGASIFFSAAGLNEREMVDLNEREMVRFRLRSEMNPGLLTALMRCLAPWSTILQARLACGRHCGPN
jgi:hypothetical protein